MIADSQVRQASIRSHYQLGTLFYRLLWGPHIHHGLWHGDEKTDVAQRQLIDTLADLADITSNEQVIDVGCGMGGSSIHLAKHRGCQVRGVTLSPVQAKWATLEARLRGVGKQTEFVGADAEQIDFGSATADVVWSVECTEHLFDKPRFIDRAAEWLKPGGRMAFAVWFEGRDSNVPEHRVMCEEVCRRFVCPSLATRDEYAGWMRAQGLAVIHSADWTPRVTRTWEICKRRVAKTGVRHLAKWIDREQVEFIDGFDTLLRAYQCGAMEYGVIVARKPIAREL